MAFWTPPQISSRKPLERLRAEHRMDGLERPQPHILSSPPGTQAPAHLINYTPDTNEVHAPGMLAPKDRLNYSLMPHNADMRAATTGADVEPLQKPHPLAGLMGMGSGIDWGNTPGPAIASPGAPPGADSGGRYAPAQATRDNAFSPGQPPIATNPYGTGPGPRLQATGPETRAFEQRGSMVGNTGNFGAGQEGGALDRPDFGGLDDEQPDQSNQGAQPASQQPAVQDDAKIAQAAVGTAPPPGYSFKVTRTPQGIVESIYLIPNDPSKQNIPLGYFLPGQPDPLTKLPPFQQYTEDVRKQIQGTGVNSPDTTQITEILGEDGKMHRWLVDKRDPSKKVDLGISEAPKKEPDKEPPLSTPGKPDTVFANTPYVTVYKTSQDGKSIVEDPVATAAARKAYAEQHAQEQQEKADAAKLTAQTSLATANLFDTFTDAQGQTYILNKNTGEKTAVGAADLEKGFKVVGNAVVKIPSTPGEKPSVVYEPPHDMKVDTINGKTVTYDPRDPGKGMQVLDENKFWEPTQQATLDKLKTDAEKAKIDMAKAQDDILTGKVTRAEGIERMQKAAYDVMHPQPTITAGDFYLPAGLGKVDVEYGGARGTKHYDTGTDPMAQAMYDDIQQQIKEIRSGMTQTPAASTEQKPAAAAAAPAEKPAAPAQQQPQTPEQAAADTGTALSGFGWNRADQDYGTTPAGNEQSTEAGKTGTVPQEDPRWGGVKATPEQIEAARASWPPKPKTEEEETLGLDEDPLGIQEEYQKNFGVFGAGQDEEEPEINWMNPGGWEPIPKEPTDQERFQQGFIEGQQSNQRQVRRDLEEPSSTWTDSPRYDPTDVRQKAVINPGSRTPDDFIFERPTVGSGRHGGAPETEDPFGPDWQEFPLYDPAPGVWDDPNESGFRMGRRNTQNTDVTNVGPGATDVGTNWTPRLPQPKPANQGEIKPPGPSIFAPPLAIGGGHIPGPVVPMPGVSEKVAPLPEGIRNLPGTISQWTRDRLGMGNEVSPQEKAWDQLADPVGGKLGAGQEPGQGAGLPPGVPPDIESIRQQVTGAPGGSPPTPPGALPSGGGPAASPPISAAGAAAPPEGGGPGAPGWTPPVQPGDVAGIGHRFGQQMDQGEPIHSGVDLQAPEGTDTISPVDGMIQDVQNDPAGLGLTVIVRGNDGTMHKLGHLKNTGLYRGAQVAKGQNLASQVGSTGNTTGSHLHWAVKDQNGQPLDPTASLGQMGSLPPVPGTQMMGPPGGSAPPPSGGPPGGPPPQQPPAMGGGQDRDPLAGSEDPLRGSYVDLLAGTEDPLRGSADPRGDPATLLDPITRRLLQETGSGQDSADARWDLYEQRDKQGFWGPGGLTPIGNPPLGAGGEGGMGAGAGVIGITPSQQGQLDALNRQIDETIRHNQATEVQAKTNEDNRHNEKLSEIDQNWRIHQDNDRRQQEINAETARHNQEGEKIEREKIQAEKDIEQMKEAAQLQLTQMQEGNKVYLQEGSQSFSDWQTRQKAKMDILSSALQNPWLQKLSGMTPGPGYQGQAVGGQNISNLMNDILRPYDVTQYGVENAPNYQGFGTAGYQPGGGAAGGQGQQGAQQSGALPMQGSTTPSGGTGQPITAQQWRSWDPFQKAAYRTDVEALGPGAWQQQQEALAGDFMQQGMDPNVTRMQATAGGAAGRAGMEMTADVYGQGPQNFWDEQQRQWSRAQAPQVRRQYSSGTSGIAA